MAVEWRKLEYKLSFRSTVFIVIYYGVLLVVGLTTTIVILTRLSTLSASNIIFLTFVVSISVASISYSLQYLRRIYKACLNEHIIQPSSKMQQFGNILYFISRPFFA